MKESFTLPELPKKDLKIELKFVLRLFKNEDDILTGLYIRQQLRKGKWIIGFRILLDIITLGYLEQLEGSNQERLVEYRLTESGKELWRRREFL